MQDAYFVFSMFLGIATGVNVRRMFCIFYVLNFVIKAKFTEGLRKLSSCTAKGQAFCQCCSWQEEGTFAPEELQLFGINANRLGSHRPGHRSVWEPCTKLCCGTVRESWALGVRLSREMGRQHLSAREHLTGVCKSSAYSFVDKIMVCFPRE